MRFAALCVIALTLSPTGAIARSDDRVTITARLLLDQQNTSFNDAYPVFWQSIDTNGNFAPIPVKITLADRRDGLITETEYVGDIIFQFSDLKAQEKRISSGDYLHLMTPGAYSLTLSALVDGGSVTVISINRAGQLGQIGLTLGDFGGGGSFGDTILVPRPEIVSSDITAVQEELRDGPLSLGMGFRKLSPAFDGPGIEPYTANFGVFTFRSAVPEPTTWALLILGFGAVGVTARRRRGVQTIAETI